jgi:6-phosphogluconolactonase
MSVSRVSEYEIWAGTYSPAEREGIVRLRFDADRGSLERTGGTSGTDNPSFLAVDPARGLLFAVSETADGQVVSYRIDRSTGGLAEIGRQPSHGDAPCHLTLDPSGRWLLAANYGSGSVSVYPVAQDGAIGPIAGQAAHRGGSVNRQRQEGPHAHSVFPVPSSPFYLVSDLGTDTIYTYRLNGDSGKLEPQAETKARPGSGPRHLAFHPRLPVVYSIEELSSTITVYALDARSGSLSPLQTVSALPEGYAGSNTCAEVQVSPSGAYVYGSNRGHDSIAVFRAGSDGRLAPAGHAPTGGRTPRHFALTPDGGWLLAANQDSDAIAVLKIGDDGVPRETGTVCRVNRPVCLKIFAKEG